MIIEKNSKLIMIGDSVTDCGRAVPVGEGLFGAEGNGYVNLVSAILTSFQPDKNIRVVNMGSSGNTIRELKERWQSDVIDLKPDWISIMIGVNDVWRQYDLPLQPETHVYLEEYKKTLEELVKSTLPLVKGMVLMTPYFIELNVNDAMRATMDNYSKVVKEIAQKYNTLFVDTQAAFNKTLENCYPASLAWDRVHPNTTGHMVIARAFLNAIEMKWS